MLHWHVHVHQQTFAHTHTIPIKRLAQPDGLQSVYRNYNDFKRVSLWKIIWVFFQQYAYALQQLPRRMHEVAMRSIAKVRWVGLSTSAVPLECSTTIRIVVPTPGDNLTGTAALTPWKMTMIKASAPLHSESVVLAQRRACSLATETKLGFSNCRNPCSSFGLREFAVPHACHDRRRESKRQNGKTDFVCGPNSCL